MDIFELEEHMEYCFHDSLINTINVDYLNNVLTMEFDVLVGLSDDNYETITVVTEELELFHIAPASIPDKERPWVVDFGNYADLEEKPVECCELFGNPDIFVCYFFISNWNSFIVIAGKHCYLG